MEKNDAFDLNMNLDELRNDFAANFNLKENFHSLYETMIVAGKEVKRGWENAYSSDDADLLGNFLCTKRNILRVKSKAPEREKLYVAKVLFEFISKKNSFLAWPPSEISGYGPVLGIFCIRYIF